MAKYTNSELLYFSNWANERDAAILEERASGKTLEEIGRKRNISRERIRGIIAGASRRAIEAMKYERALDKFDRFRLNQCWQVQEMHGLRAALTRIQAAGIPAL